MKSRTITLGAAFATAGMVGSMIVPGAALASSKGRKNTAVGLGAAAAHQILTGKTGNGVLLGAGAAYAYKRYQDAKRDETRQKRTATIRNRTYRSGNAYGGASTYRSGNSTATTTSSRNRYGGASGSRGTYAETKSTYVPNGSYYFTGKVINDATELTNRNITIDHNGVARRVYVPKSATVVQAGEKVSMHDLRNGDMVRVLAVRGQDRWNASKVELLSSVDADVAMSNRDTFGDTYTRRSETRRGGSDLSTTTRRESRTARYNGVGIVQRVSEDGNQIEIRAGQNVRTVFVDGATFSGAATASDFREGDRVRVTGTLDGTDVNADQVTLLD